MLKKKGKAIVESKAMVENVTAPIAGGGIIFAYAEKSQSFMSKDIHYMVTFSLDTGKKELRVPKEVYDCVNEGDAGELTYRGGDFVEFKIKK